MTRTWTFTLANANQWYNLWKDLIDPTITDKSFSNSPYVSDRVSELEIQNLTGGTNLLTAGADLIGGFGLSGQSWDVNRTSKNAIDLRAKNFSTDTAGSKVYVSITFI